MGIVKPKYGVNLRLPAYSLKDQWAYMQNVDMGDDELFRQILGSVRFHGTILGTNAPTHATVNYNNEEEREDVLVCVDDKILRKQYGPAEFSELIGGLTPNYIRASVSLENKTFFAHPKDGIFRYDGIAQVEKVNDILLSDIIISKETNRAFGIRADVLGSIVWTDNLSTIAGEPIEWNALNVDKIYPTRGDVPEKLFFLNGRLIIVMTNSVWVYYVNGSPSNWRPEQAPTVVGFIAPSTMKQVGEELWGFGFSPETGLGVYAFNGRTSRLLSYDISLYLGSRVNLSRVKYACAELVQNIYKLSIPVDGSLENNVTFHIDTINVNPETNSPNIYGPHTYGFSCSALLNTRKFRGEHLIGRKHTDGARLFRVADYRTQYSNELADDGDMIAPLLVSPIYEKEQIGKQIYGNDWIKRFERITPHFPPVGSWSFNIDLLVNAKNQVEKSIEQFSDGNNFTAEEIDLGSDALNFESQSDEVHIPDVQGESIQFKLSNFQTNKKFAFREIEYDVRPIRRKKRAQVASL